MEEIFGNLHSVNENTKTFPEDSTVNLTSDNNSSLQLPLFDDITGWNGLTVPKKITLNIWKFSWRSDLPSYWSAQTRKTFHWHVFSRWDRRRSVVIHITLHNLHLENGLGKTTIYCEIFQEKTTISTFSADPPDHVSQSKEWGTVIGATASQHVSVQTSNSADQIDKGQVNWWQIVLCL